MCQLASSPCYFTNQQAAESIQQQSHHGRLAQQLSNDHCHQARPRHSWQLDGRSPAQLCCMLYARHQHGGAVGPAKQPGLCTGRGGHRGGSGKRPAGSGSGGGLRGAPAADQLTVPAHIDSIELVCEQELAAVKAAERHDEQNEGRCGQGPHAACRSVAAPNCLTCSSELCCLCCHATLAAAALQPS